ncbi:MAG: major capsid protein [Chitinivibrionia bacterium]|nr:major capsid protein [Chitinivibrionia bacterium]
MNKDNFVNLYEPRTMLAGLRQVMPPRRFFHNTFFKKVVTHTTPTVEFDLFKGSRRIAAYVNPVKDGVVVEREGYETKITRPAYIKEKVATRPSDTATRAFGENIYNASTPDRRAAQLLGEDLAMLDERIMRREEQMCAEALITGKVIVKGDGWDAQVDFGYTAGDNIKVLSGSDTWDNPDNKNILETLDEWRREIIKRCGIIPTHCVVGNKVAWAIIQNKEVREVLDNARMRFGEIAPSAGPDGISNYGPLYLPSGVVNLISYEEYYTDPDSGESLPLMPEDKVLLGSSNARCAFHYGMIQNMNFLGASPRFPFSWQEKDGSARWCKWNPRLCRISIKWTRLR